MLKKAQSQLKNAFSYKMFCRFELQTFLELMEVSKWNPGFHSSILNEVSPGLLTVILL